MTKPALHGFAPSTYVRSARMACIEKDIDSELVPIAYGTPDYLSLHPFGKMPVLTHGDVMVFETVAIISYLDHSFPGHRLISDDPMEQVRTLTAITVAVDYAYRPVVFVAKSDGKIEPDKMSAALRIFDWMQDCLNSHPFMVGPDISAADVLFAPMLAYHIKEQGDEHVFAGRKNLDRWFRLMSGRASFAESAE